MAIFDAAYDDVLPANWRDADSGGESLALPLVAILSLKSSKNCGRATEAK